MPSRGRNHQGLHTYVRTYVCMHIIKLFRQCLISFGNERQKWTDRRRKIYGVFHTISIVNIPDSKHGNIDISPACSILFKSFPYYSEIMIFSFERSHTTLILIQIKYYSEIIIGSYNLVKINIQYKSRLSS